MSALLRGVLLLMAATVAATADCDVWRGLDPQTPVVLQGKGCRCCCGGDKTTTTTTTTPKPDGPPECPKDTHNMVYMYPVSTDCSAYYACFNGKYHVEHCPPGQLFSDEDLLCEPDDEVDCGSKPNPKS